MGTTKLYFSTTNQGTHDGSSIGNAAALFTGGAWSTHMTAFPFTAGSDALECRILPGTYTITASLTSVSFSAGAPTAAKPMLLIGCDSSGVPLTPSNRGWTADQPSWTNSSMPIIATTTNIVTMNLAYTYSRFIKWTATAAQSSVCVHSVAEWSIVENSLSNASAAGLLCGRAFNCVITMAGATFSYALGNSANITANNCRVVATGGTGGTGNRRGIQGVTNAGCRTAISQCCVIDFPGQGVYLESSSASSTTIHDINKNTIVNAGSDGIYCQSTATPHFLTVHKNCITGCTEWGVNGVGGYAIVSQNRIRNCDSGTITGLGNIPSYDNYTTASDDATEYYDSSNGDYRINIGLPWSEYGIGVSVIRPAKTIIFMHNRE